MTFEEDFPSLLGINNEHSLNKLTSRQMELIQENCLDKAKVKGAIKKLSLYCTVDNWDSELLKELKL